MRKKNIPSKIISSCIFSVISFFFFSCGSGGNFNPRPRGLNHIEIPEHAYQSWNNDTSLYSFEHSKFSDVTSFKGKLDQQIISYNNGLEAKIWLTYFPINNIEDSLAAYIYTSYKLLQKHNVRASAIINDTIGTSDGRKARVFYLEGDVPSMYQFYIHDSTTNFLRGAMYFETAVKNDSLKPVYDYVREDINHLLESLEWHQ